MAVVYNSLTRRKEELVPSGKGTLSFYVCGITPYDYTHLGHARTYVAFDIIRRYLLWRGKKLLWVQNVTDVDDKIIRRAAERKEEPLALSHFFDIESRKDLRELHVLDADEYPRVSGHIPEIIALVQKLIDKGYAYVTEDGVYYDVSKFKDYGKLSHQNMDELKAGARIAVDEKKRSPMDFALWKTAKPGELSFESPWGRGRPGWHIECSAMSMKYIGETVDVHGGARDLIFPHHENEIAQSEGASEKQFVRYWLHTGFLTVNGEKMAKSLGNFVTIKEMMKEADANSIRLFFALAHYRSPIDFSRESISQAKASVERIFGCERLLEETSGRGARGDVGLAAEFGAEVKDGKERFISAMEDDFDTPRAMAALFGIVKDANTYCNSGKAGAEAAESALRALHELVGVIGLKEAKLGEGSAKEADALAKLNAGGAPGVESATDLKEAVELLILKRKEARAKKDYAASDRIRNALDSAGVVLEDTKEGARWKLK